MYPSEIEIRQMTQNHLQGGIAPSRHALARRAYLERQRCQAHPNTAALATRTLLAVVYRTAAAVRFTRIGAFWSTDQRVVR
jgi:hypothetical protein